MEWTVRVLACFAIAAEPHATAMTIPLYTDMLTAVVLTKHRGLVSQGNPVALPDGPEEVFRLPQAHLVAKVVHP